jgi:anhydro-N-acetylmuramic acid kinase
VRPREVAASRLDAGGTAYAVGIMSGTSADGVDAALTRIEREGPRRRSELISLASRSYGDALRRRVLEAQEGRLGLRDLFALGMELSEEATAAAREAAAGAGAHRLEVVGFHGQTVFHDPRGARSGTRVTVQIGEPAVLARALGAPVVSNFRMADVLAGGEGAPLVPRFDFHQFASDTRDRVLLNLGGIANLTRLRAGAGIADVVAFDCGPGNMLLDGIVAAADMATGPAAGAATGAAGGAAARSDAARFDAGGTIALRGAASEGVVGELLGDPYFSRRPPKSAGREEFGTAYLARFLARTKGMSLEDRLRTAAAATAEGVVRAIALSGGGRPDEILVSGGGARNEALLAEIRARVGEAKVETTEPHGVPIEAKEAMAFAFLAFESLSGRPGNVPAATGAEREVVLGSITPPPAPR